MNTYRIDTYTGSEVAAIAIDIGVNITWTAARCEHGTKQEWTCRDCRIGYISDTHYFAKTRGKVATDAAGKSIIGVSTGDFRGLSGWAPASVCYITDRHQRRVDRGFATGQIGQTKPGPNDAESVARAGEDAAWRVLREVKRRIQEPDDRDK